MWPSNNIVCETTKTNYCTSNYFTESNLSVTVSQRHRHLSEEIFYDSLGIGIQIRGGAKSALRCPRIWLPTFDVIILEAIVHKVNGGIQIRGGSKSALPVTLTSASAFATRFCVEFYATLLGSLCRVVTLRSYISAEYHGAKEDSLLFLKFLHGHMVSRVN